VYWLQAVENYPWSDVACGVVGFAMQGDFEFLGGLLESDMYRLYHRTRLEHMLDLMFSHSQIRNPVEYHFRLGLEFWNASDDEWFFTRWRKSWGLRVYRRRLYTLARCRSNTTIVSCSTRNITIGQRRGAAEGLFGEVSQHVGRLQTVNAHCVSLAFPIDSVSFGTPTQNFPGTRPWCI